MISKLTYVQVIEEDFITILVPERGKTPMWVLRVIMSSICMIIPLLGAIFTWSNLSFKGILALGVCVLFGLLFLLHNLNKSSEKQQVILKTNYWQVYKTRLFNPLRETIQKEHILDVYIAPYKIENSFKWFSNFYYHNDLGENTEVDAIVIETQTQKVSFMEYAPMEEKEILVQYLKEKINLQEA